MIGDFEWQEDLVKLCEYVSRKLWFNNCLSLPNSFAVLVKENQNYPRYSKFKKKRLIQKFVKLTCEYLKLNIKYINLKIEEYSNRFASDYLWSFRANSKLGADIYISYSSQFTIYRQAAIIIHELTHYFAYSNNITFETEDERCTDILCLFLGFYPILSNGYAAVTYSNDDVFGNQRSFSTGYLSDLELQFCQTIISSMRREKQNTYCDW